jgi:hypothetical protein
VTVVPSASVVECVVLVVVCRPWVLVVDVVVVNPRRLPLLSWSGSIAAYLATQANREGIAGFEDVVSSRGAERKMYQCA